MAGFGPAASLGAHHTAPPAQSGPDKTPVDLAAKKGFFKSHPIATAVGVTAVGTTAVVAPLAAIAGDKIGDWKERHGLAAQQYPTYYNAGNL